MEAIVNNLLDMGTANLILSFAVPFISSFIIYYLMCKLLPNRLNIYGLLTLSLIYTLWYNLRSPELLGTSYHLFMNIFINAFTYSIVIFLFKGKFFKKLIVWWYFDIIKTMCQTVSYVPVLLLHSHNGTGGQWALVVLSVETDASMKFLHMSVFIPLFLLLGFLSLSIWRGILMRKFHPFYLLFLALPMGIKYSLSNVFRPGMGDWFLGILINFTDLETSYYILSLFGISIGLAATITIFYYILSYDKRAAIEAELAEAKYVMELEQARFSETEKRSEELAKIRHDFNNQLASITQLVRSGEDGAAREIISALTNEINREKREPTTKTPATGDGVVNLKLLL